MKTKKIRAIQFRLDVEKETKMMPEPASLLERARRFPQATPHLSASDYGATVDMLREKGYTWKEVGQFIMAHGADFTDNALYGGYQTWFKGSPRQQAKDEAMRQRIHAKAEDDRKRADVINILWAAGRKVATVEELDCAIAKAEAARAA
jgi:hypothetical protein